MQDTSRRKADRVMWLSTTTARSPGRAAGHQPQDTTARNYEHLSPSYLRLAVRHVDAFFEELSKHTQVHVRYTSDHHRPPRKQHDAQS